VAARGASPGFKERLIGSVARPVSSRQPRDYSEVCPTRPQLGISDRGHIPLIQTIDVYNRQRQSAEERSVSVA
jgi:hypothetical protein